MQSFPDENHCKCFKKLASTLWSLLFTLTIFSFTYTLLICGKIKSCCDHCFPQQSRPQNTVQLYILHVRICFNMNNKYHSLPILYIHHVSLNMQVFVIVLLRVLLIIVLLRVKGSMW